MSIPLKVGGIRASRYKCEKFAALFLYFLGTNDAGKLVYALLRCEIHLVKGLRPSLLIGNDIMSSENFVINIEKKTMLIGSCKVTVSISARQRGQFFIKKLLASKLTMVFPQSKSLIPFILVSVLNNRDFFSTQLLNQT